MRKLAYILTVLALAFCFWQCSDNPVEPEPDPQDLEMRPLTAAEQQLVSSGDEFGLKLFREVAAAEQDSNFFISPLSISVALGMVCNGAAGDTRQAMLDMMDLNGLTVDEINQSYQTLMDLLTRIDPRVDMEVANSIWYRQGFPILEPFLDVNRVYFDARVSALDFANPSARTTINNWVAQQTHGLIPTIIDAPIPPLTMAYLINAIYFKGDWTYQFEPDKTYPALFQQPDGSWSDCLLMQQETDLQYLRNSQFQAVSLPYGDGDFRSMVLLPNYDRTVDDLISSMTVENWDSWLEQMYEFELELHLPKFKLEYKTSLVDALSHLGMGVAFSAALADFSNMSPELLYISSVIHKTFVEVDELGTEAAAVTSVGFGTTGVETNVMRVTRPFVFVVYEQSSGCIVFAGKIVNPGVPG